MFFSSSAKAPRVHAPLFISPIDCDCQVALSFLRLLYPAVGMVPKPQLLLAGGHVD